MASLRERRQKETRADILMASRYLFLEKGYEATTMEQIAEKADIGTGTLYNYFPSKDEIFLSVMSEEVPIDAVRDDQDENGVGGYGVEDALLKFLNRYIKAFKLFKKSLWRDVMSIVFAKSGSALFKKWFSFDMRFVASLEKKLQAFKKDGCLPVSFDCGDAAFNIYSVLMTLFVLYIYTDDMTVDDFEAKIRNQIKLIISGKG